MINLLSYTRVIINFSLITIIAVLSTLRFTSLKVTLVSSLGLGFASKVKNDGK